MLQYATADLPSDLRVSGFDDNVSLVLFCLLQLADFVISGRAGQSIDVPVIDKRKLKFTLPAYPVTEFGSDKAKTQYADSFFLFFYH